jgi:hypothetical protein
MKGLLAVAEEELKLNQDFNLNKTFLLFEQNEYIF